MTFDLHVLVQLQTFYVTLEGQGHGSVYCLTMKKCLYSYTVVASQCDLKLTHW